MKKKQIEDIFWESGLKTFLKDIEIQIDQINLGTREQIDFGRSIEIGLISGFIAIIFLS